MLAIRILSRLPLRVLYLFSDFLYLIVCHVIKYRADVVDKNLAYAFPRKTAAERRTIKKKFYRNFTDSLAETIKLMTISERELARRIKIDNLHLVLESLDKGQTVIGLTAHFFNWEAHLVAIMAHVRNRCDLVYLKIKNPFFDKLMREIRGRFGGQLVERNQFRKNFLKRRNMPRLIVLAADQRPQQAAQRYWKSFMNREAAFFEGAEKLAKKFNHRVVYAQVRKPKRGHYVFTYEILEDAPDYGPPHSITDSFIKRTESNILLEPSLYLWSHNRWRNSPTHPAE